MDRAGSSHAVFQNPTFEPVPQNDPESGVEQDNRSCATKAFKWVVRHPFLAAAGTIGLVGFASGGIYGLSLLGAAAPAAVALSGRNVTTEAPDVTTEAPDVTTEAPDVTTEAPDVTTEAPDVTTESPDVTTESPDVTTESPDVTTESPDVTTESPDVTTKAPDVTTKAPDVTTKAPDVTTKAPDVTTKAKAPVHTYSLSGSSITIPLRAEARGTEYGFVAGENTKGVPDHLTWAQGRGTTNFSVNLRGSDGQNYEVNLIAKQNLPGCGSLPINGAGTSCHSLSSPPPDAFSIEFGDNSRLPTSLSYEGSFTLNRVRIDFESVVLESYRFDISKSASSQPGNQPKKPKSRCNIL